MKPSFNKNTKDNKKYKNKTITKKQQNAAKSGASDSIGQNLAENNQIISGYFLNEKSYKEMIIARVNRFLYIALGVLVLFCLICYYFVSCKEVQLNLISRETLELNYENDELQYKVDSLQSYYNVDKAVSKSNILERAKKVVEVDATNLPNYNFNKKLPKNVRSFVVNY